MWGDDIRMRLKYTSFAQFFTRDFDWQWVGMGNNRSALFLLDLLCHGYWLKMINFERSEERVEIGHNRFTSFSLDFALPWLLIKSD